MSESGNSVGEADIQAWTDGRLDESRRVEVEAWLAQRPEEAERAAAYRDLNEQVRALYAPVLGEPVPARLAQAAQRRV